VKFLFVAMREALKKSWDFDTIIYWAGALGPALYHRPNHKQN